MAQPASSDQKLVQSAVRGSRKAFRDLFERYFQALYNYALTLTRDPALAEDITQEAFIRAHANLSKLGPPWNFHAWIFRLARNYFIDLVRKDRDLEELEDERQVISLSPSPERETFSREVSDRVHGTLSRLPDRQREILVLRELQGFSYAEIGQIMELSDSNVKVSLHRARSAFQESYGISLLLEDPEGDCREVAALLDALHDGEDLLDREQFLKEHLRVCEACQKRRDLLIKQSAVLGALIPVIPPRELAGRILEEIDLPGGGGAAAGGQKALKILGVGGMGGLLAVSAFLAFNILFHTSQILPNFPGWGGAPGTQAALPEGILPPSTPTPPTPYASYSGPVPPAERCALMGELDPRPVFLNIREATMSLPMYFKTSGDIPGLVDGQLLDAEPWIYQARLGEVESEVCSLQGYDDRLYCLFTIPDTMPGTYQDLALSLNGCEGTVLYFPKVSVPAIPEPVLEPQPACRIDLNQAACEAAGGQYFDTRSRPPYCLCPD